MEYVLHSLNIAHTLDGDLAIQAIIVDNRLSACAFSVSAPEPIYVSTFLEIMDQLKNKLTAEVNRRKHNES